MSLTTTPTMDTHPNPSIFREPVRIQIRRFFENMATHYTHYASKRVDFSRPASTKSRGYELWQKKKSTVDLLAYQEGERGKGSRGTTSPLGGRGGQARHRLPHPQNVTWSSGYSLQSVRPGSETTPFGHRRCRDRQPSIKTAPAGSRRRKRRISPCAVL
jgi:hypothetical protein